MSVSIHLPPTLPGHPIYEGRLPVVHHIRNIRQNRAIFFPIHQVSRGSETETCCFVVVAGVCEVKGSIDADDSRIFAAADMLVIFCGLNDWGGVPGEVVSVVGPGEAD